MSSGTTSVYPTSLSLVLVCVPVTPDNEVTSWSVAPVASRERNAENHMIQHAFRQILRRAEAALLAALLMLPPGHTMDSVPQATPPGLSAQWAPMHIHGSGPCCKKHGKEWYSPRPGLCLICVAHGQQSYANFPRLSRLLEATEDEP